MIEKDKRITRYEKSGDTTIRVTRTTDFEKGSGIVLHGKQVNNCLINQQREVWEKDVFSDIRGVSVRYKTHRNIGK